MDVSRRAAIGTLVAFAAGAASACTPLRMALRIYPGDLDAQPRRVDRILRAFATTVVPSTPADDPDLVRAFYDDYYPLAKYRNYFVADLCRASEKVFGTHWFERLTLAQRTKVIDRKQKSGGVTTRLYNGAILMIQITCYAGIYDEAKGCPLIDFPGRYRPMPLSETSYPEPERFLAAALTRDGNPS